MLCNRLCLLFGNGNHLSFNPTLPLPAGVREAASTQLRAERGREGGEAVDDRPRGVGEGLGRALEGRRAHARGRQHQQVTPRARQRHQRARGGLQVRHHVDFIPLTCACVTDEVSRDKRSDH